jgi:hypothetical protein
LLYSFCPYISLSPFLSHSFLLIFFRTCHRLLLLFFSFELKYFRQRQSKYLVTRD